MSRYPLEVDMATTTKPIFVVDESLCYGCGACIALCPTNALDLVLPNSNAQTVKKQRVSVSINENFEYFIDKESVELKYIEAQLIDKLAGQDEQVVVLRVDKSVSIEYAVEVMDIAYRNKFKIVLATQQKRLTFFVINISEEQHWERF